MKKHKNYIIKGIIFTLILLILWNFTNRLLLPNFYYNETWATTTTFKGFYQMEKDSVDVLFLGSSMVAAQFNPQVLYDHARIQSYNLGCEQQNMITSYFWLKEALKSQSPKVVFLDTYMAFLNHPFEALNVEEGYTRKAIDCMKWSSVKWEAVRAICENDPKQYQMSYFFPNIRFHSRWSQLTEEDFAFAKMEKHYELKGYAPLAAKWRNKDFLPFSSADSDERAQMLPLMKEYLDKIVDLCKENGIELILVKTPAQQEGIAQYNAVNDYAAEKGVPFLDFTEETLFNACGLDAQTDMNDDAHGNIWGAEKVSVYLADLLRSEYGITQGTDSWQWENTRGYYENVLKDCELKYIKDISEYLKAIEQSRYVVFVTVKGKSVSYLTDEIKNDFARLGMHMDYENGLSYYAFLQAGEVIEENSTERLCYKGSIRNCLTDFEIISSGDTSGIDGSVKIDNKECSKRIYGINLVVYNTETMQVVDAIGYNGKIVR